MTEQPEKKKFRLNETWTYDLWKTGPVLKPTELSSQLEAGHLWILFNPIVGTVILYGGVYRYF